jgi:hypothetical protein
MSARFGCCRATATQIRDAMLHPAEYLGSLGYGNSYGHELVKAKAASEFRLNPIYRTSYPTSSPSAFPTAAPCSGVEISVEIKLKTDKYAPLASPMVMLQSFRLVMLQRFRL